MDSKVYILGGGLAGCMALAALKWKWPELDVKVLEKSPSPSQGEHTWCFHDGDVEPGTWAWLTPLISKTWNQYDVRFPRHRRTLSSRYHSIRGHEFHAKVRSAFPDAFLKIDEAISLDALLHAAKTNSESSLVIRATGWPNSTKLKQPREFGWQKFVGLDLRLSEPHGLRGPILKDATIEQLDGYRFMYTLPWDERTVLVEDTYYSNTKDLDLENVRRRILEYARLQGWKIELIQREEVGALPLEMSPNATRDAAGELSIGAASGLAHPVTGYTTSSLFFQLEAGLKAEAFSAQDFRARVQAAKRELSRQFRYFHLLNRMLFFAASPESRYQVLERFYGLDSELIERFYAGRLKAADRVRILVGRPPVPLMAALREWREWQFAPSENALGDR